LAAGAASAAPADLIAPAGSENSDHIFSGKSDHLPVAWQVTLDGRARKVVVDEAGAKTELPMKVQS
jgi:hypothetical protein